MTAKTLYQWFADSVRAHPSRTALIADGVSLTYAELDAAAARIATELGGGRPTVGLLASRSPVDYAAYLGALRAGGVVVPLNSGYPAGRNLLIADNAGLDVVVLDAGLDPAPVEGIRARMLRVDRWEPGAEATDTAAPAPAHPADPDDVAYMLFTSGSTGRPKGVPIRHRNLDAFIRYNIDRYTAGPGCRFSQTFDLTFDPSVFDMFVAWGSGATLVVPSRTELMDPASFVNRHRITHWYSVPSLISLAGRSGALRPDAMPDLRWSLFAGDRFTLEQAEVWADAAPDSTVENLYGPTELSVTVTAYRLPADRSQWPSTGNGTVPIGEIYPHLEHRLSAEGELQVRGPQRFAGYLDRADDPGRFDEDERAASGTAPADGRPGPQAWYRTGDRMSVHDGDLVHEGRLDNQIKVLGRRLEPEEVEAAVRSHTSVAEVIVAAVPDEDAELCLVAIHAGPAGALDRLRAHVPAYMVPRRFVEVDALPLNANGKADRAACRELALRAGRGADGRTTAPSVAGPTRGVEHLATDDAAASLLEIFRTRLDAPDMGPESTFYAFGGDSLIAVRVVTEAQRRGLPLTLRDLLLHESVAAITALPGFTRVRGDSGSAATAQDTASRLLSAEDRLNVPDGVEEALPASAMQTGMLFQSAAAANPLIYHLADGWEVAGTFSRDCFRTALGELSRRHPALRTSFDLDRFSRPMQLVWENAEPPLTLDIVADADEADLLQDDWLGRRAGLPFDLGTPRLLRCHVTVLPESFRVCLAVHHAVLDGWSLSRLAVDLMSLYHRALGLPTPELPEPAASAQREFLEAEHAASASPAAEAHWLDQADVVPLLPVGARVAAADPSETLTLSVEAELVERLSAAAVTLGVSLKSVALAAHVRALAEWTGRNRDLVTGLSFNTRPAVPGVDLAVGLFVNTLPVRVREADGSWDRLVEAVAAAELAGLTHQAFPQARIVQLLGRRAFDVNFNFMNFHAYRELRELPWASTDGFWRTGRTGFTQPRANAVSVM